jgi:archaellum component FlaF (FlaF/FlaG flagellin family)
VVIEYSISLGNVLTLVSILVALLAIFWKTMQRINEIDAANMTKIQEYHTENTGRLVELETKVDSIWTWWTRRLERRDDRRRSDDYNG